MSLLGNGSIIMAVLTACLITASGFTDLFKINPILASAEFICGLVVLSLEIPNIIFCSSLCTTLQMKTHSNKMVGIKGALYLLFAFGFVGLMFGLHKLNSSIIFDIILLGITGILYLVSYFKERRKAYTHQTFSILSTVTSGAVKVFDLV